MKISLPRREIVFAVACFFICGSGVTLAFKQWSVSRSGNDFVAMMLASGVFFLMLGQLVLPSFKMLRDGGFEIFGEVLTACVEMVPGDVLLIEPLEGIAHKKIFVRVFAHLEERPGMPYKSFRMSPSPIRHNLNSTCDVVLLDTSQTTPKEIARGTVDMFKELDEDYRRKIVESVELFVEKRNDFNSYCLQVEPILPEVLSHDEQKLLKWNIEVTVGVLVKRLGLYEEVRLKNANMTVIPAETQR